MLTRIRLPNPPEKSLAVLQRLPEQGVRYIRSLVWLVKDSIRVAPGIWLRVVLATFLNLGSNAVVAGAVYSYVKLLQHDATYEFLGVSVVARESLFLLFVFIGVMTLAILTFAASEYVSKAAALKLHRRYQEYMVERVLKLLQLLPDARCPQVAPIIQAVGTRRLITGYPHSCSWSLRFIANAVPNLILFVAGYAALLWLDPGTTLIVTGLGAGVVAAQYPVHLLAARSSNIIEETNAYVNQKLGGLIALVSGFGSAPDRRALDAQLDEFARDERVKRNADADEDRYRAMELSALSMQTGGGVVLAAMLLTIGSGLLSNSADWAVLLVYATLLRRLLSGVTTVFRTVTVFSRFSPHVQICRSFIQGAAAASVPSSAAPVVPDFILLSVDGSEQVSKTLRLNRGDRVACFSAGGLDRELAIGLQAALYEGQRQSRVPMPAIRGVTPNEASPPQTAEEALEAAVSSGAGILLMEPGLLGSLSEERRSFWLRELENRYVVVIYPAATGPAFSECTALIRDRSDALHGLPIPAEGLAPEQLPQLTALMNSGGKAAAKAVVMDDDAG